MARHARQGTVHCARQAALQLARVQPASQGDRAWTRARFDDDTLNEHLPDSSLAIFRSLLILISCTFTCVHPRGLHPQGVVLKHSRRVRTRPRTAALYAP